MYGSNFCSPTVCPRATSSRPSEADAIPLPSEETTPPVTKTNRVMMGHRRQINAIARRKSPRLRASQKEFEIRREFRLPDRPACHNRLAQELELSEVRRVFPDASEPGLAGRGAP